MPCDRAKHRANGKYQVAHSTCTINERKIEEMVSPQKPKQSDVKTAQRQPVNGKDEKKMEVDEDEEGDSDTESEDDILMVEDDEDTVALSEEEEEEDEDEKTPQASAFDTAGGLQRVQQMLTALEETLQRAQQVTVTPSSTPSSSLAFRCVALLTHNWHCV